MSERALHGVTEAILLVTEEPVTAEAVARATQSTPTEITAVFEELHAEYERERRGFELRCVAGGWRLYTREEFAPYVERFVLTAQNPKLTQAALETLAVVAYQQPTTRTRVAAVRGVNCDAVMRTLVTRGLVAECGSDASGAHLYETTPLFLEKMGLRTLEELPPIAPLLPDAQEVYEDNESPHEHI